ncbi:hypothetical protein Tco_0386430 [Tanacetum coccineum]
MGCFANRGKWQTKSQFGRGNAGRLNTRDKTWNLSLKEVTDKKGPVRFRFERRGQKQSYALGDHAAHWSSYIGEVIRGVHLYYPSWLKVSVEEKERKAALITDIGTQFDLRPHMESPDWTEINAGIQQHLQKAYNTNKAAFKTQHWVIDPTTGTFDVEKIRRARPEDITTGRVGKRSGTRVLGDHDTLLHGHALLTGIIPWVMRDPCIYEEMRRLEATGTYTDDEINRLARRGKQRGHIPGVGRVGFHDESFQSDSMYLEEDEDEDGDGDRNVCHGGTSCLTEKYVGPTLSLGIVTGERIPCELSPTNFPQRQVDGESPELSPGKKANVVVVISYVWTIAGAKRHPNQSVSANSHLL